MRLLMISASAGHGHVRAAEALEAAARGLYPEAEVRNVDILDFTQAIYRKAYAASYLKLADGAPELWGYFYNRSDRKKQKRRQARIIRAFDRIEFKSFRDMLKEFAPDHILCSHFLPAQVLQGYEDRDWFNFSLNLCVTDFMAHKFWAQLNATRIFANSGEAIEELVEKGVNRERVRRVGIPIMPEFSATYDRDALMKKLGLEPGAPVVMAMGGGWGAAGMPKLVAEILGLGPVQILAIAGRNERMREKVAQVEVPEGSGLHAFGYVNNIHEMMAVSDLCVTKSGGLTSSECLAMGLPMIVPNPIPGQEERNAEYLTEYGAALTARSPGSLKYKIGKFLGDPALRERMKQSARAIGTPDAASRIVRAVVEDK